MKLEFLRSVLLAAALCTASGLADAAFTSVQLNCQNAPPRQVIDTSGGPASDSCSTSGVIDIFGFAQGPFTAAADGFADYAFGSWGAAVTYTHPVSTGTGIGALATSQVGAIDSLTLLAPVAGVLSFTASVNRIFGSGVDFGISAGTLFGYVIALGTDECLLHDSGSCTVSIPFSPGDVVLYNWGGSSDAAVSGSGFVGSGFAFDSGSFEIQNITFRDAAGNPINGASIQSQSGFDYLGAVQPPIPEPETWALMLAGLSGMAMLSRRRRRPE
jgi:hypothetical protein